MNDSLIKKVDDLDRKIISLLEKDGKMKYTDIARECGIRNTTVHLRVDKLLESGVIKKFTIQTEYGFSFNFFISITVLKDYKEETKKLIEDMTSKKYIRNLYLLNGGEQILMVVLAENFDQITSLFTVLNSNKIIKSLSIEKIEQVIKIY